ncbi:MAG TPA: maleylacetoacetate isomerase [Xanthomonadales bacterium]|nr:maleylacetoacetate isomerase [Xanthomonadales bacterium]
MAAEPVLLYGYWRSSSSYRVRIALNLKGIDYQPRAVHLLRDGGEQKQADYRAVNPLGLVPALVHGAQVIVQSVAICEYLEECFPAPALLPAGASGRARVRTIVQTIASEIQPLNNLGVLSYLGDTLGQDKAAVGHWLGHWVERGFSAIERWLENPDTGEFCHGDSPTLADCFLVPQVYNAERFGCDLAPYPRLMRIAAACRSLEAFRRAAPENQPDAA